MREHVAVHGVKVWKRLPELELLLVNATSKCPRTDFAGHERGRWGGCNGHPHRTGLPCGFPDAYSGLGFIGLRRKAHEKGCVKGMRSRAHEVVEVVIAIPRGEWQWRNARNNTPSSSGSQGGTVSLYEGHRVVCPQ